MEYSSGSDLELPKITRKRKRCESDWKNVQRKKKRNSGAAYTNVKGMVVQKRCIGKPCSCQKKCFEVLGMAHIQTIFDNYWALGSHDSQTSYLSSCISSHDPKRSRVKGDRPSRKLRVKRYVVKKDGNEIEVCLKAFLSIHDISEKRVRNVSNKETSTGTIIKDQRGRHVSHKLSDTQINLVRQHIGSLKTVSSHYSRAKSPHRKYLPPGLNINILYEA